MPKQDQTFVDNAKRIVSGTTCFAEQKLHGVDCLRRSCRHWIDHKVGHNCTIISADSGPHTLQEIGQIYDLTRMRICQIEKDVLQRIKSAG